MSQLGVSMSDISSGWEAEQSSSGPVGELSLLMLDLDDLETCDLPPADLPFEDFEQRHVDEVMQTTRWSPSVDRHPTLPVERNDQEPPAHLIQWKMTDFSGPRCCTAIVPAQRNLGALPVAKNPPKSTPSFRRICGKIPKKRRVVKKDPNRTRPKPWSQAELATFRQLIQQYGPKDWKHMALLLGTNRTAKSLHTRWLREQVSSLSSQYLSLSAAEIASCLQTGTHN